MSDMNDLKLQGRIVRDAVIKTKNEKQIAYFTLAVNQTRKNADGSFFDEANYFPCSVFVSSEKFAAYLKKGQPLILLIGIIGTILFFITGYLCRYRKYDFWRWKRRALFRSILLCLSLILLKGVLQIIK